MSTRSDALANRVEECAEALAAFAEGLSQAEWETFVDNDNRSVGTVVHHVASAYLNEIEFAKGIAAGNPIVGVTNEMIDGMNAEHAGNFKQVDQVETIAMLRQNSKTAADAFRAFTDEELDTAVTISVYADAPLTTQFFIEDHPLRHSLHHLANIKAVLDK